MHQINDLVKRQNTTYAVCAVRGDTFVAYRIPQSTTEVKFYIDGKLEGLEGLGSKSSTGVGLSATATTAEALEAYLANLTQLGFEGDFMCVKVEIDEARLKAAEQKAAKAVVKPKGPIQYFKTTIEIYSTFNPVKDGMAISDLVQLAEDGSDGVFDEDSTEFAYIGSETAEEVPTGVVPEELLMLVQNASEVGEEDDSED